MANSTKNQLKRTPIELFNQVKEMYQQQIWEEHQNKPELTDAQVNEVAYCHALGFEVEIKVKKQKCIITKKLM